MLSISIIVIICIWAYIFTKNRMKLPIKDNIKSSLILLSTSNKELDISNKFYNQKENGSDINSSELFIIEFIDVFCKVALDYDNYLNIKYFNNDSNKLIKFMVDNKDMSKEMYEYYEELFNKVKNNNKLSRYYNNFEYPILLPYYEFENILFQYMKSFT